MIYLVKVWPRPLALWNGRVEAALNRELGWIRFDDLTWFVHTNKTANELFAAIEAIVGTGNALIIEVRGGNSQGRMPADVWDWVNARRGQ